MKVAYIINQYPKGSHSFIRREILALERQGVAVQRIAMRGWDAELVDPADYAEQEVTQHVLRKGMRSVLSSFCIMMIRRPWRLTLAMFLAASMAEASDRSMPRHWMYLAEACVVARWVEESGATHLHAHFGTNSTDVAMLASKLTGLPYSFTAHGSQEVDRPHAINLHEKIERAAFVAAVSSYGRSQLYRWVGPEHWPKIHVVPCGIDDQFRKVEGTPYSDSSVLICVGRLSEEKGQLLLLQALRKVIDEGYSCQLVLAGDGELRGAIEAKIAKHRLQQHVRITGWISGDQVREEIEAARALVLPSFIEGLPVVIMEAMAMSRPVVATFVGGVPELVLSNDTGWLVPAGNVDELAKALTKALSAEPEQLTEMGRAARERVLERHNVDNAASQLAKLFAESNQAKSADCSSPSISV